MLSPETTQLLSDIAPALALGCGVVGAALLTRALYQAVERTRALEDRLATAAATPAPGPQRMAIPLEAVEPPPVRPAAHEPSPVEPAAPEPAAARARRLLHEGRGPEEVASLVGLGVEQVGFLQRVDRYLDEHSEVREEPDEGSAPRDLAVAGIRAKTF